MVDGARRGLRPAPGRAGDRARSRVHSAHLGLDRHPEADPAHALQRDELRGLGRGGVCADERRPAHQPLVASHLLRHLRLLRRRACGRDDRHPDAGGADDAGQPVGAARARADHGVVLGAGGARPAVAARRPRSARPALDPLGALRRRDVSWANTCGRSASSFPAPASATSTARPRSTSARATTCPTTGDARRSAAHRPRVLHGAHPRRRRRSSARARRRGRRSAHPWIDGDVGLLGRPRTQRSGARAAAGRGRCRRGVLSDRRSGPRCSPTAISRSSRAPIVRSRCAAIASSSRKWKRALLSLTSVEEAAVFTVPDGEGSSALRAAVVAGADAPSERDDRGRPASDPPTLRAAVEHHVCRVHAANADRQGRRESAARARNDSPGYSPTRSKEARWRVTNAARRGPTGSGARCSTSCSASCCRLGRPSDGTTDLLAGEVLDSIERAASRRLRGRGLPDRDPSSGFRDRELPHGGDDRRVRRAHARASSA